jgi:hypothetical protein
MVNAAVKFGKCPEDDPNITLLDVKLNPDSVIIGKPLEVSISGRLNVDIPESSPHITANVVIYPDDLPLKKEFCECKNIDCPIKAGTDFGTVLVTSVPEGLGKVTKILINIYDDSNEKYLACAVSETFS